MSTRPILRWVGCLSVMFWFLASSFTALAAPPTYEKSYTGVRRSCKSNADCNGPAYCSGGSLYCSSGLSLYPFCNPKSNRCDVCLQDDHCPVGKVCGQTGISEPYNSCATNGDACGACATDLQCQTKRCGAKTKCSNGTCIKPASSVTCQPPNLVIVLDRSCSMSSYVTTDKTCSTTSQCASNPDVPYRDFSYTCTSGKCRYARWDVAVSALHKAIATYGGTAPSYEDRKVRFGLVFFGADSEDTTSVYHGIVDSLGNPLPPTIHQTALINRAYGGNTNYSSGLDRARTMLQYAKARDSIPNRKSAILFVTDGDPTVGSTGCSQPASPNPAYTPYGTTHGGRCNCAEQRAMNLFNDFSGAKTYVVGFGSGISTNGFKCLNDLANSGRTKPASCTSGPCLFFQADSAASLASAFAEIIDNATQEACDGLDNNCDGRVDENVPGCSCLKSYTKNVSTSYLNRDRPQNACTAFSGQKVKQYTFLTTFSETNDNNTAGNTFCLSDPGNPNSPRIDMVYNAICRNETIQALSCPATTTKSNPPGDAFGVFCHRCVNRAGANACSWPLYHACNGGNRQLIFAGADDTPEAFNNCKNWCRNNKARALNCGMPQGKMERAGLCEDPNDGKLQAEPNAYAEFGALLNARTTNSRIIFVNREYIVGATSTSRYDVSPSVNLAVNLTQAETRYYTQSNMLYDYNPTTNRFTNINTSVTPQIAILNPSGVAALIESTPGNTPANTAYPLSAYRFDSANTWVRQMLRISCSPNQCAANCRGALCCSPEECEGCTATTCPGNCDTPADCLSEAQQIISFLRGDTTTLTSSLNFRSFRLGAIYHSTPALLTRPLANREEIAYLEWLKSPLAGISTATLGANRPTVAFVGSNDGFMHAFHADTGMELWSYVPKTVLPNLKYAIRGTREGGGRAYTVDGSPVVGNYQIFRYFDDTTQKLYVKYRSVLLFGLGMGGRGYVALDVTDPYRPLLMWEINNHSYKNVGTTLPPTTTPDHSRFDRLGYTVARPSIANVLVRWDVSANRPSPTGATMERAVAILPGGASISINKTPPTYTLNKNDNHIGAVVYIVDLETGAFLSEIVPYDPTGGVVACISQPMCIDAYRSQSTGGLPFYDARGVTGTPVGYPIDPSPATRLFFGDMLGRIFRVDLGCTDSSAWSNVNPTTGQPEIRTCTGGTAVQNTYLVHDLFKYDTATQPLMTSMAIALTPRGEILVAGGTGDVTNVESYDSVNKVFSLREVIGGQGEFRYMVHSTMGELNKSNDRDSSGGLLKQNDMKGYTGEKMTGDPIIVNGITYFTTFDVSNDDLPICGLPGEAKMYGLRYEEPCADSTCIALKTAGRYNNDRTPVLACNPVTTCGTSSSPVDCQNKEMRTNMINVPKSISSSDTRCYDLDYTQPMLITEPPVGQPDNFQYYRYHAFGKNTLSMGPTISYTPGEVQNVPRNPSDPSKGSNVEVKKSGKLAVQVSLSRLSGANQFLQPPNSIVKNSTNATGSGNAPIMMNTPPSNKTIMATDWVLVLDN